MCLKDFEVNNTIEKINYPLTIMWLNNYKKKVAIKSQKQQEKAQPMRLFNHVEIHLKGVRQIRKIPGPKHQQKIQRKHEGRTKNKCCVIIIKRKATLRKSAGN